MDAYSELEKLCMLLSRDERADRINLDFSVVNDMSYYNGIVFTGFIKGIPDGVLAGGEYGGLVRKMGQAAGAVGFAVYLDMLEELSYEGAAYDVDVLIVYDESVMLEDILERKAALIAEGKSVGRQRAIPEELR